MGGVSIEAKHPPMKEEIMTPAAATIGSVDTESVDTESVDSETVELDVIPIDDHGWRVSIRDADRANPFGLLGFVSKAADGFEVCIIGHPGDAIAAPTLEAALDVLRPEPDEVEAILEGVRH